MDTPTGPMPFDPPPLQPRSHRDPADSPVQPPQPSQPPQQPPQQPQRSTSQPPPPPPPVVADRWPTLDVGTANWVLDGYDITGDMTGDMTGEVTGKMTGGLPDERTEPTVVDGDRRRSRLFSESTFQDLRSHLTTLGLALLLAIPVGGAVFFVFASVAFAFDDRTFRNSQSHTLIRFWYVLGLFVVAAVPATFVLLRRGRDAAIGLIADRGYWRVLLSAYVILPVAVGIVALISGHLIAFLVVIGILLVVLMITGGGF